MKVKSHGKKKGDKFYDDLEKVAKQHLFREIDPYTKKAVLFYLQKLTRKKFRRRPERLKIKSLQVSAETARGLKPILVSKGSTEFVVHGHNPERVTLGSIGNMDVYCYPRIWDDRVFMGLYPNSVQIEMTNWRQLFALVMRIYWALKTNMESKKIKQILFNKCSNRGVKRSENQIRGKWRLQKRGND